MITTDKIRVLLVEDEQTLSMIIKDTLEEKEFLITTAKDGEEGIAPFHADSSGYISCRCNDAKDGWL